VNGNNLRFLTLTATLSHRERELKEVAINGRSKYNRGIAWYSDTADYKADDS
jgi:hypothetical protein